MMNKLVLGLAAVALATSVTTVAVADDLGDGKTNRGAHFQKVDTNGDGMWSKSEFIAAHEMKFAKLDANDDGSISKDELKAKRAEMREKRKARKEARLNN